MFLPFYYIKFIKPNIKNINYFNGTIKNGGIVYPLNILSDEKSFYYSGKIFYNNVQHYFCVPFGNASQKLSFKKYLTIEEILCNNKNTFDIDNALGFKYNNSNMFNKIIYNEKLNTAVIGLLNTKNDEKLENLEKLESSENFN